MHLDDWQFRGVGTGYAGLLRGETFAFGLLGATRVDGSHHRVGTTVAVSSIRVGRTWVVVHVVVAVTRLSTLNGILILVEPFPVFRGGPRFGELLFDFVFFHAHFFIMFFYFFFGLIFERIDVDVDPME